MLLALLLATAIDADAICAKHASDRLPPAAVAFAAKKKCGDDNPFCNVELAESYANGKGVPRNLDLAETFLCRAKDELAPMELEGMLEHIQKMRTGAETADLSFCNYVTSGYGSTYCANVRWQEEMPKLDERLARLGTRSVASAQFAALRKAGLAFVDADTERISAMSIGGTGHSAMTLDAEVDSKTAFVTALETLTRARARAATASAAARADARLNDAYREQQRLLADVPVDDVDMKKLLRNAQRAWITYRDAFAAYYVERWRGAAPEADLRREVVTQLSLDRAAALAQE